MANRENGKSRRDFLSALGAGTAYQLVRPLRDLLAAAPEEGSEAVETIVIGSGFGGAVAALRLAQAGFSVTIIERGIRWPITPEQNTFATLLQPDGRAAWLSPVSVIGDNRPIRIFPGVLERLSENGIRVFTGAGVGGGSLVYGAVLAQPDRALFSRVFPPEITYDELDRVYYPRVRSMLKSSTIPPSILSTPNYLSTRVFLRQAEKTGLPAKLMEAGIDWGTVELEFAGARRASVITGESIYGINSGAKNSVDQNYLALAEATGQVSIRTLHVVTEIGQERLSYVVACNLIDLSGNVVGKKTFICKKLFLAAGSMGTSKLLVKAKARGTLPLLNEHVGEGWGNNGDGLLVRLGLDEPTGNIQGGFGNASAFDYGNPLGPVTLENANLPLGGECNCLNHLSMGIPSARGSFSYNPASDSVSLTWPPGASESAFAAAARTVELFNSANGGIGPFFLEFDARGAPMFRPGIDGGGTFHPLGGAVIGKACDYFGRVKGYKNLYVVDSALLPGSAAGVNPALTVTAIAERCMDRILANNNDDNDGPGSQRIDRGRRRV